MSIIEMKVPVIGESITEVTLSKWLVADGDYVNIDDPICEFESDKATLEFPAEAAGTISFVASEEDDLEIGALVAKIDTSASGNGKAKPAKVADKPAKSEAPTKSPAPKKEKAAPAANKSNGTGKIIEMKVPVIGESITEVTLSQWLKNDGEVVNIDEPICEFESDKATLEFPAEATGKLIHVASEGDDLEIGALVAKIEVGAAGSTTFDEDEVDVKVELADDDAAMTANKNHYADGYPSPAAAKLMAENKLTETDVKATGKDGRITKEDVLKAIQNKKSAPAKKSTSSTAPKTQSSENSTGGNRSEERKKMSRMRRTIAKRLVSAKNNTAMLTTFNEVDLTNIMAMRKQYQEEFVEKYGVKLGFMSLFSKACAKVLMEMPDVNGSVDGDHIVYHDYVDISIAISTPNGLVVPPIKNVEKMKFHEIELAIKALAGKARAGELTLDEMTGGTFTITNGGIFGSMMSTPILNEPQSAILGMHTIQQRPMAINGEVKIRPMMYLALSYDHRIIDGSTSVTFLVKVKQLLEDPVKLMLL